ncbi:hypothetical protein C8F04DRAFT_969566 [Mycena alexandri]|uniref:Uncharacterized protein n=1 Tax=Mycena alexandri TaxID=1745969 RepID=A0AAD6WR44_9AGAR|nr:hypothetical protein C8F04DRAFT_969566 [Mycena alexandri]
MSNQPQPANDSNDEAKRAEEGTGTQSLRRPSYTVCCSIGGSFAVLINTGTAAQSTQNAKDEKARRQAAKDLAQSWMDRLQLISVITTFFASTEAGMLQVTGLGDAASVQVANAAFTGALVLHIWAAIISFLAAFFLVRYNLKEAKEEGRQKSSLPAVRHIAQTTSNLAVSYPPVWTMNPHLEQIGPFQRKPPTHLLSRCHNLCILLTFAGFLLALLGILAFAWGQNPVSVGVVTSVSTAVCAGGAIWVFL